MKILILGGGGFVGTYLYRALCNQFQVTKTYVSSPSADAVYCDLKTQSLTTVIPGKFDIVINNINPASFSYTETMAAAEQVIGYCRMHQAWLINISSLFADDQNRHQDPYAFKKFITDEVMMKETDTYTILRFPQLFDYKGLARKSQAGLYFLIDFISAGKPVTLLSNSTEPRNYMAVENLISALQMTIQERIKGVHNVYIPSHTIDLNTLAHMLADHKPGYNPDLITTGQKPGISYVLPPVSPAFINWSAGMPDLRYYLSNLMQHAEAL